ncbi:hypothetical protein C0992_006187 [Termitomyces sp. T32_za158]|nr:hypothetical protein C0992_006187 [Termitomyces sp. T32_za158]
MGKGKAPPVARSRQTRSSRGRLLTGPADPALLATQLRALGLYAADTLGDGNCLFRALSDQLYGSPSRHADLRQRICDWIARHHERYEPFVDDDRGLETHLRCMREHGTYGGHMELSAFAHMEQRDVKVVQPGLVYVIEHHAFDRRRPRRTQDKDPPENDTVYIAYHDWEHFSSIRNLRGPHTGLPLVRESPPPPPPPAVAQPTRKKVTLKLSADPTTIPLPTSRAPSPPPAPAPRLTHAPSPKRALDTTADDSECSASSASLKRPRRRDRDADDDPATHSSLSVSSISMQVDTAHRVSTPPSSPDPESASGSSSESSPPPPPPPPPQQEEAPLTKRQLRMRERERVRAGGEKPLTRRQRKALGIVRGAGAGPGAGAGKIVIPGGRFKRAGAGADEEGGGEAEEWVRNGTGRVDVRGFRELKI